MVRPRILIPVVAGSNPVIPALGSFRYEFMINDSLFFVLKIHSGGSYGTVFGLLLWGRK